MSEINEKAMRKLFSERLGALIREKGIQQNNLADILGVSESTVGKWLLEKAMPRMGAIQKLADYFGVSKSYFLEKDDTEKKNGEAGAGGDGAANADEASVLSQYRRLSPEGKQYIHAQLRFRLGDEAEEKEKPDTA